MPEKNELTWEEYEAITRYIYGGIGQKYGVKVIGYGRDCKVIGKSGVSYQIDVLTEQPNGDKMLRTAIECKFLKEKVTNDTVMKLWCVIEDAGIESGIIVCKTGFTRDTLIYAEHKGIKLVELREAKEKDFDRTLEIGDLDIHNNMILSRINMTQLDFGTKVITDERQLMGMHYAVFHDDFGRRIPFAKYHTAFAEKLRRKGELLKSFTIDLDPGGQLYLKLPDGDLAIEKIAITGFHSKTDTSITKYFRITDQVWLIMKELFDNRNFTMSKSGGIWNLPSDCTGISG